MGGDRPRGAGFQPARIGDNLPEGGLEARPTRTRPDAERLWPYALGAALVALGVRVPFRTSLPPTWDSVQFCLAIRHYNIELHQPHPPGYFLYAYTGKLIHALGVSPYGSLVALSLVAGAVMAGVLTWWAGKLGGRTAAVATGALAVVSPLAWNYATTGDTYAVSGMMAAVVGWLCWRVYTSAWGGLSSPPSEGKGGLESPPHADVIFSALALAVAGGMRPTDALFLFPLWLYCVARRGGRAVVLGLVVLGAGTAAWLGPMLHATGGLARYLEISHRLSAGVMRVAPWAAGGRADEFLRALGIDALPVLFIGWIFVLLAGRSELTRARLFLTLWLAPAALFFAAVHLGTPGYLMVLAPVLILLAGIGLARVSAGPSARQSVVQAAVLLGVTVALNVGFLKGMVIDAQREEERDFREIQAACAPYAGPETAVLTTAGATHVRPADLPFRTAMYLLPDCPVFLLPLETPGTEGGIANEGYQMGSSIHRPPLAVPVRRMLVDASLVKLLQGFPPPTRVVSNDEGELWLVETRGGIVLGNGEIKGAGHG